MGIQKALYLLVIIIFTVKTSLSQQAPAAYPRITAYTGILIPVVTFSNEGSSANFSGFYLVGVPVGINLWKTPRIGFSLEMVPFIRSEHSVTKMSNVLFHPGILVSLGHGFTFAGRAAFETSGRFGFTPVFNKIIIKNKQSSIYVALPFPVRFGNEHPASFSIGVQLGFAF